MPCPHPRLQSIPPRARRFRRRYPHPPAFRPAPRPDPHVRPPFDSRQSAKAFNQPLSFDTSSVTNMRDMFKVRFSRACPQLAQSSPYLHAACPAVEPATSRPPPAWPAPYAPHRTVCPPFYAAERKRPVQRQQAAHPLRMGEQLGLRLCWLCRELGSGKLLIALHQRAPSSFVCAWPRQSLWQLPSSRSPL